MTADVLHCDRCGCALPAGARRLCPACQAIVGAPGAPRKGAGAAALTLGALLLVAFVAGWIGWRLVSIEGRLADLAKAKPPAAPEPLFSPEETQALKHLAARPPAAAEDLAALKEDMARLKDVVGHPGIPNALKPMPPGPAPVVASAPPAAQSPSPKEDAGPSPLTRDLSSVDPMARYQALALVQRPSEAGAAVRLLQDDLGFVRRGAAEALGRLKLPETATHLVAMVRKEQDVLARRAALEALERITGVPCVKPGTDEAAALAKCEAWCEARK